MVSCRIAMKWYHSCLLLKTTEVEVSFLAKSGNLEDRNIKCCRSFINAGSLPTLAW